ncbi:ABC transporter ATP-binding protein [uncultured Roseibium sp.]|uniref:ABC transporter ATP-binding protein n=1 Tax=uncultured Roseibium sp. TaxID=1936171 RepID=UPI0032174BEB
MFEISDLKTPLIGPVSLSIAPDECVSLRGASGAGKSLLLRAIADLDPNEGDARLDQQSRNRMPAPQWRRLVALVPAESGWWTDTVVEHFKMDPETEALLEAVGLPDSLDWKIHRLSTGEKQRLALARALHNKPKVLLLDEPTSALDDKATARVEDIIREQMDRGVAVLLVTHDQAQAQRVAGRHFLMEHGRLSEEAEAVA